MVALTLALLTAGLAPAVAGSLAPADPVPGDGPDLGPDGPLVRSLETAADDDGRSPTERALATARAALQARADRLPADAAAQGHRNLEAAERSLAIHDGADRTSLETALLIAQEAGTWQAESLGTSAPSDPAAPRVRGPPSMAVAELAARHDVPLSPAEARSLERLDALPDEPRQALNAFLRAFLDLDAATRTYRADTDLVGLQRLAADPPGDPATLDARIDDLTGDIGPVLSARSAMLATLPDLHRAFEEPVQADPVRVPPLIAVDPLGTSDEYTEPYAIQVDVGGNDTYLNNAGGSNLNGFGPCVTFLQIPHIENSTTAALVDLRGDDTYGDADVPRCWGINGGGSAGGTGTLVDVAGDDRYLAGHVGVNGGGAVGGSGLMVDVEGDDERHGREGGVNGGNAFAGTGGLVDLLGNDVNAADRTVRAVGDESVGRTGVNGGSLGGAAFLLDGAGHDVYRAAGSGTNGGATAGSGHLLDVAGNDTYVGGSSAANGGGVFGGTGFLFDVTGFDTYVAGPQATNGGGSGLRTLGMLLDARGDDRYEAREAGTNGGGYGGPGFLIDLLGDDRYTGGTFASNGGARDHPITEGTGLLFDGHGHDVYDRVRPLWLDPAGSPSLPGTGDPQGSLWPGTDPSDVGSWIVELPRDRLPAAPGGELLGAEVRRVDRRLGFAVVTTSDPALLATRAARDPDVVSLQPNGQVRALGSTPDDPLFDQQYGPRQINATQAWETTTGDGSVRICLPDSGIRADHEDLAGRVASGIDIINGDADPFDDYGHGTHVAGIAAAATGNGVGIAGIANATLLSAKVLDDRGFGTWAGVASGIRWCVDQGADVISLSLGGSAPPRVMLDAVGDAWSAGVLVIAAAGNSGSAGSLDYPGRDPRVMAVACSEGDGSLCGFSSYGIEVEVTAPGDEILSTLPRCGADGPNLCDDTGYGTLSGTSMSAPHVAGAAALLWTAHPDLTHEEVRVLLRETASDRDLPGCGAIYGFGVLDVDSALDAAALRDRPIRATDDCPAGHRGVNGGAYYGGRGALVDLGGNDAFEAGRMGVNGGAYGGATVGLLYNVGGDDRYVALDRGANGAGYPTVCSTVVALQVCLEGEDPAYAGLIDGGGTDVYLDDNGGSGTDRTVVPKGTIGAQIDLALSQPASRDGSWEGTTADPAGPSPGAPLAIETAIADAEEVL